jgi:hypothetical protein
VESSATGRAIVARLKLLEDLLERLEASEGHSREDWRAWVRAARASGRRSKARRDLAKRVRGTKRNWFPLRDLIVQNSQSIAAMEREVTTDMLLLAHGPLPKCARNRDVLRPETYVTHLVECWILDRRCVENARHELLAILDKQRQLAPMREVMEAIAGGLVAGAKNPKLHNADGSMKRPVFRILDALRTPRTKLEGVRVAGRFRKEETVREFTAAMRRQGWIDRSPDQVWSLTVAGSDALKRAKARPT